jgi:branched-chain amino acid transport system ATP-binding protein
VGPPFLLKLDRVVGGYGKKEILHGVGLEVAEGETVCLIGPNGAGKSTVLLTIMGFLKPRAGKVWLKGRDVTGTEPHDMIKHGVGFCPQRRNIFPDMTVAEHLDLSAWTIKDPARKRAARDRVYRMFPILQERQGQRAQTMSGGQRQMLTLAMAMMPSPMLILLDEPTIGLAPMVVDSVFESMAEIHREGVSILLVEQNAAKALAHSDRAYVLETGQNRHEGRSSDLLANPTVRQMYLGARMGPSGEPDVSKTFEGRSR